MGLWDAARCAALLLLFSEPARADAGQCTSDPRVRSPCVWSQGVLEVPMTGYRLAVPKQRNSISIENDPPALTSIRPEEKKIVATFRYCLFASRPQIASQRDAAEPHGCIADTKDITVIENSDDPHDTQLCKLVDCRQPGFLRYASASSSPMADAACKNDPRVQWGCFDWFGTITRSDKIAVIDFPKHGTFDVVSAPSYLSDALGRHKAVAGEVRFCPLQPALKQGTDVAQLEWQYRGCISSVGSLTTVDSVPQ
jgi:hypothetical protein